MDSDKYLAPDKHRFFEFREVENAQGTDADIHVYFLDTHVDTIKNTWTRPGGYVYTQKEACVKQAQRAIQQLWDQAGGTR
jgi:hypothetical protein